MHSDTHLLLAELPRLVTQLGRGGGVISPSVYDTAQLVRFTLTDQAAKPPLEWLLSEQQADGGWGNPDVPYARHVPTLAAVLALNAHNRPGNSLDAPEQRRRQAAIAAGLAFVNQAAEIWRELALDLLPIAAEMILPRLIEDAVAAGLPLVVEPYQQLFGLRERKCFQLHQVKPKAGAAPTYSWEAWGNQPAPALIDHAGGIGHSPSATAAWLRHSRSIANLAVARTQAEAYLQRAADATGVRLPGVVPNVYPITGFELTYGLYALLLTDLFDYPPLQQPIAAKVSELQSALRHGNGMSFGEQFSPDADSTGLAVAILAKAGYPQQGRELAQFKNGDHFYTFPDELNPSVFSNAHALYALATLNRRETAVEAFLIERQRADGAWLADKWHSSWIYNTLEVGFALQQVGYEQEVRKAVETLVVQQQADGSWGSTAYSRRLDTSYALIMLYQAAKGTLLCAAGKQALERGYRWLVANGITPASSERVWLGKELYSPYRVDRIYEVTAILATARVVNNATTDANTD